MQSIIAAALKQRVLVARDIRKPDARHIIEGCGKTDRVGDIARAGFEAVRRWLKDRSLKRYVSDHVAAALPWRHRVEHRTLAVDNANPRWPENLVS